MVSDQEPRYRLVDSDGNIVGSLYGKADGSVAIQETDSGADREATLAPDGTFSAPSGDFDSVSAERTSIGDVSGRFYLDDDIPVSEDERVQLQFSEIEFDNLGEWNTQDGQLTPENGGKYTINIELDIDGDSDVVWRFLPQENGSAAADIRKLTQTEKRQSLTFIYSADLDANDSLTLEVEHDASTTQTIEGEVRFRSNLYLTKEG